MNSESDQPHLSQKPRYGKYPEPDVHDKADTAEQLKFSHTRENVTQIPSYSPMDINQDTNDTDDSSSEQTTPTLPTSTHKYWKIAASDAHQPHRFLQFMDNIKLHGDTITDLCQFYERIRLAFHLSFIKAVDFLPPFRNISPKFPFGHILVPHNEYYLGYHSILNTYNWFGTALYTGLTDSKMISPKLAPNATRVITTERHETDDWNLLYTLLCSRNPLLGGNGDDVLGEITNLRINNDDDIHTFYDRVIQIQEKIEFGTETISETKLLEKYLQAMSKSVIHHHFLQYYIIELNLHISRHGHNNRHPSLSIQSIYRHQISSNAPITFQLKNIKKFRPNIAQLTTNNFNEGRLQYNDNTHITSHTENININNDLSTFILQDDKDEKHFIQYDPTIQAFRHHSNNRPKNICEACGLPGHAASKCFRCGFDFLARDVQRRIAAYNTKYGTDPSTDTSIQDTRKEVLPAPVTKLPNHTEHNEANKVDHHSPNNNHNATIRKLQHVLPEEDINENTEIDDDIEFIHAIQMDDNTPVIRTMHRSIKTKDSIHPPTPNSDVNPLSIDVLTKNGEVNTTELHALQTELIQATPLRYFTPHRQQYFHVDTGANVHATTDKADFLIFYRHKRSINIAAGQIAQSEGYGVVMVQLIPNRPPLPLAPVYYCPRASTGTLSPQCLKLYNNCTKPTHHLFESLSFICPHEKKEIRLQTTKHNNLDFLHLSTMHFSTSMRTNPTIATLYTNGLNNQLAHQRFDHRSMEHILTMKKKKLMNGIPANVTNFHDEYTCPICALTKATKIRRHKTIPSKLQHKKGDILCMDYAFWNKCSIRGFTSLLSVICMTTQFSFAFPTRNKRPPLATISWLIEILRTQGFSVTYVQTDEGGELGRSGDFLKLLTDHKCIFLGTGRSGSSLNSLVERPNRTITNAVRAKLTNSGLGDEFWCFAAEDAVFKQRRTLHTSIGTTPYYTWFNRKPDYSDMRVFGSHVPDKS